MTKRKRTRTYRRGYPVALLVGMEPDHAALWQVFSHVAKPLRPVKLEGRRTDPTARYNFHESIIDALRPAFQEGVKSVIVTAPTKTTYTVDFMNHVRKHHAYLLQSNRPHRAAFIELTGSADQPHTVAALMNTPRVRRLIAETTADEADHLVDALNAQLFGADTDTVVLYTLGEIEQWIYGLQGPSDRQTAYLLLTDAYLAASREKARVHRLLQIATNRQVATRIVPADTAAGARISQLGGVVLFTLPTRL